MKQWVALLLALVMLVLASCAKGGTDWKEQYDLGAKYLSDGNYQEAILAFSAAIEIEPKAADAYVGRADAYVGAAVELANGGITPGTEQSKQILIYLQNAETDYETALNLAESGSELSTDAETVAQKLAETTERKDQVAEQEAAVAGSDVIPEDGLDGAELEAARTETADALALLDYGVIIAALDEMGAQELRWTCRDSDQSGHPELYIAAVTSPGSGRYGQLFADAETEYFEAYTATGAAGGSSFCRINLDGTETVLWSQGYYTVGNTIASYATWNGGWETFASMNQTVEADTNGGYQVSGEANWDGTDISPEEFSMLESSTLMELDYDNPALDSAAVSREWTYVRQALEDWAAERGCAQSVLADLDGDGLEEQIFLLQGAANAWFDRLTWEMLWEDELFLNYRDARTTAIVASQSNDGVLLRMVRLDGWSGTEPEVTADGLVLGSTAYTYHSAGTALTAGGRTGAAKAGTEPNGTVNVETGAALPFYGVWTGAFQDKADADAFAAAMRAKGLTAAVYNTADWSNLNPDPWYVISTGEYATEAEANAVLPSIQAAGYANAYVKYTGDPR